MRFLKKIGKLALLAVFLVTVFVLLDGTSEVKRIRYRWGDEGVEHWDEAAVEAGVASSVEEYYYLHLSEELREPYREIYVHLMRNEDAGTFLSEIGADDFWNAYYAVLADHPEIFWIGTSAQVEESGLTHNVVNYEFQTIVPKEARQSMLQKLEESADAVIAQMSPEMSEYEKIKYVYEYIINTTDYDAGGVDTQSIQSVLLYGNSVCAGYSKAFQYILNRMGMFCTYVIGTTKDGGDHGWNMVRIGENYYYVDVTWGDPVFANKMDSADTGTVINYNYLCCTQEELFKTHIPSDLIELPQCTADDYNYYKRNGFYYETFDYDALYNALMNSVWNGETSIVMKFGNREAYESAKYELFESNMLTDPGQYLMEINGVSSWNYRYHTEEEFYLITIYWY